MPIEEVKQILSKYLKEEGRINELLQEKQPNNANQSEMAFQHDKKKHLSVEEAMKRNKAILKDLETVKGNLRSKAIYSPSEMQWNTICKRYQTAPSLPITSWRCHTPVFV